MSEEQTPPTGNRAPLLIIGTAVVGVVMAVTVLLAGGNGQATETRERAGRIAAVSNSPSVGYTVDDFTMTTLDGDPVQFSDYRGQIVLLNFWATWCVPCQREMPAFEAFMSDPPEDVVILALNNGEDVQDVVGFLNLYSIENLPVLMDVDYAVADSFGVKQLPITYVIDGEGVVRQFHLGEMTESDITAYINEIRTQ
jgi:thiol-disulfide isomerase/thioredoxin